MLSRTAIHTSDSAMIVRMVLVYRSTMCVSFGLGRSPRRAAIFALGQHEEISWLGTAIRGTKRYERFGGIAGSIRFNARELHHFGRLFGFVGEELTEVGR